MLKQYRLAAAFRRMVAEGVQLTLEARLSGQVQEETDISPTLAANLRTAIHGRTEGRITFSVLVLPHSGRGSTEKKTGADLALVLGVHLPKAGYQKALLMQAKKYAPGSRLNRAEITRLKVQCRHMLRITQSSYVMLYEKAGISVADAAGIRDSATLSLAARATLDLRKTSYYKPLDIFMQDVFKTFGGDRQLGVQVKDLDSLRSIAELAEASNAVAVLAQSSEERVELQG